MAYQVISKKFAENWLLTSLKLRIKIPKQKREDLQDHQNLQDLADQHQDHNQDHGADPDQIHLNMEGLETVPETETQPINLTVSSL